MKKVVVLSGAGISAESGLRTFRDADGLWEGHDVTEVASPEGWATNRELVLNFYNERRKQALDAVPNQGHLALAELEKDFNVVIVTQNVDDLHEKAGSSNVIHLHGELFKSRSTVDESLVYEMQGWELNEGDLCEKGSQLRPHIVWFGEMVPKMDEAVSEALSCDIFIVVGTSLAVYPAAGLLNMIPFEIPKFIVDPNLPITSENDYLHLIEEPATTGLPNVCKTLIKQFRE